MDANLTPMDPLKGQVQAMQASGISPRHMNNKGAEVLGTDAMATPVTTPTTTFASNVEAMQTSFTPTEALPEEAIMERTLQEGRYMIRNNRTEATFRLQPENLGQVELKLTQTKGELVVNITVENNSVRELMESRMDELRVKLTEDQPNRELRITVNLRQDAGSGGQTGSQNQNTANSQSGQTGGNGTNGQNSTAQNTPQGPNDDEGPLGAGREIWGKEGLGIFA